MADLAFNLLMLGVDLLALRVVHKRPGMAGVVAGGVLAALLAAALSAAFGLAVGYDAMFATLRFAAWASFVHAPLLLLGGAAVLRGRRPWKLGLCAAAAGVLAVGADA